MIIFTRLNKSSKDSMITILGKNPETFKIQMKTKSLMIMEEVIS